MIGLLFAMSLASQVIDVEFNESKGYSFLDVYPQIGTASVVFEMGKNDERGLYELLLPNETIASHLMHGENKLNFHWDLSLLEMTSKEPHVRMYATFEPSKTALLRFDLPLYFFGGQEVQSGPYVKHFPFVLRHVDKKVLEGEISLRSSVPMENQLYIIEESDNTKSLFKTRKLEFGYVSDVVSKQVMLSLRSNSSCTLSFRSENGGALVHQDRGADLKIPYKLFFDGEWVDLKEGMASQEYEDSFLKGSPHEMKITLYPNPRLLLAGRYQDQLVLSVDSKL